MGLFPSKITLDPVNIKPTPTQPIDAVIFDIGMVLLFFDFKIALPKMERLCSVSEEKILSILFSSGLVDAYDRGKISTEEFAREGSHQMKFRGNQEEFIQIWSDIFRLNDPMAERARAWKRKGMPLFLLSNTCEAHIEFFKERYDIFKIFDGEVYSCREKCAKPDQLIYDTILDRYRLNPQRTLFIDDRSENITGASHVGIQAIQYIDEKDLKEKISIFSLD